MARVEENDGGRPGHWGCMCCLLSANHFLVINGPHKRKAGNVDPRCIGGPLFLIDLRLHRFRTGSAPDPPEADPPEPDPRLVDSSRREYSQKEEEEETQKWRTVLISRAVWVASRYHFSRF